MKRSTRSMWAVEFAAHGGCEVLDIVPHEIPRPGPGEVVVEVLAAGINHIEAFIREGRLAEELPSTFPQSQGSDFAGIVVDAGAGVTGFARNDEVLGHAVRAAHATHVVVPATSIVQKPKELPWEIAGGLYLAGVTAVQTIEDLRIGAGDTVVVSAAAGGVGSIETQLAKRAGARVIGTCGERNFDYLRQQGIIPAVYGDGIAERIEALAPNGVSAYIDNFGQDGRETADALGVAPGRYRSSDDRRDAEIAAVEPTAEHGAHLTRQLDRLARIVAAREVAVLISGFYPFDFVRDAFDDLERLHARGKIVLGMRPVNAYRVLKARDVADARP